MRLSVLIVDDEPHARRHLKNLLTQDDDVEVIYECKNGKETINFLKHQVPSIIFLDINMPGLNGIEVASQLKSQNALIIFSTAYDTFALQAFKVKAFDYLLKPFEENRFFEVLDRAKNFVHLRQQAAFGEKFTTLYQEYNKTLSPHLTTFDIKEKGFEYKLHVEEILYLEASSIYAVLHLNNKKVLYRAALNLLEQQLPQNFIRIHRSFIINQNYVTQTKYLNNNTFMLTLSNNDIVISSRKYKDHISKRFGL